MAEALAKHIHPLWTIDSAGTNPSGDIDPLAAAVLNEVGLKIEGQAHSVSDMPLGEYDLIITLCSDEDVCPLVPESVKPRVKHIPFDDPSRLASTLEGEELLAAYRRTRGEIEAFCRRLDEFF